MLSIFAYMDERDIAREVQMERMVHSGSFLVLEGSQDVKRFRPFIDEAQCSIVCAHSVKKATLALRLLERNGLNGVVGVIDADFHRILGTLRPSPNLIYSSHHDLDLDWVSISVLERYLTEVGDEASVQAHGGPEKIFHEILDVIKPISCARLLNAKRVFKFKVSNVEAGRVVANGCDLVESYIDELVGSGNVDESERHWIRQKIGEEMSSSYNLLQLTNGHDFCSALGAYLRTKIGSRREPQAWGKEVALHLRLTVDRVDFFKLAVASELRNWEKSNAPYRIFN